MLGALFEFCFCCSLECWKLFILGYLLANLGSDQWKRGYPRVPTVNKKNVSYQYLHEWAGNWNNGTSCATCRQKRTILHNYDAKKWEGVQPTSYGTAPTGKLRGKSKGRDKIFTKQREYRRCSEKMHLLDDPDSYREYYEREPDLSWPRFPGTHLIHMEIVWILSHGNKLHTIGWYVELFPISGNEKAWGLTYRYQTTK